MTTPTHTHTHTRTPEHALYNLLRCHVGARCGLEARFLLLTLPDLVVFSLLPLVLLLHLALVSGSTISLIVTLLPYAHRSSCIGVRYGSVLSGLLGVHVYAWRRGLRGVRSILTQLALIVLLCLQLVPAGTKLARAAPWSKYTAPTTR